MLFGISDNNPYGKFPMGKDEDGYITILRDLHIESRYWYLFIIFLNTGSIPGYDDYQLGKDYKYTEVSSNIEALQEICCKFGGVPSFDLFRDNFYKGEAEQKTFITANTPEEDTANKYQWRRVPATNVQVMHPEAKYGWSCASTTAHEGYNFHNYRRSWKCCECLYTNLPIEEWGTDESDPEMDAAMENMMNITMQ